MAFRIPAINRMDSGNRTVINDYFAVLQQYKYALCGNVHYNLPALLFFFLFD
jgi:hypothetical protein